MNARLLVTGGRGFLGRQVCRAACAAGYAVTTLSLHAGGERAAGVEECLTADLADADALKSALAGRRFDYVVNCGGYIDHRRLQDGGRALIRSHFDGLLNLLELLDREELRRFVQIGSSDEYGGAPAPQHEDLREDPISPYSLAKASASHLLSMLWKTERFPATTLRLFLTYGPGQDNRRFLPQIIEGCLAGRAFPVSEGAQLRDFCYVDDVVKGILDCLTAPEVGGEVINLGSGIPVTIRHMIERVRALVGNGTPEFGRIPLRSGENPALYADTGKARRLLGWNPAVTLDEGLARTIDYYKAQT